MGKVVVNILSRRDFLKMIGLNLTALIISVPFKTKAMSEWPIINFLQLPKPTQKILNKVPLSSIAQNGYLYLANRNQWFEKVALTQTDWNLEKIRLIDKLVPGIPWAIVFHWYGDHELFDKTISGYLRGFNQNRKVNGHFTQTSAHFLVGPESPFSDKGDHPPLGIVQLQKPFPDGTPYLASSLAVDIHAGDPGKRTYYLRAAEKLKYQDESYHSILIDLYYGQRLDPNLRSIAIEITGKDFDQLHHYPSSQQIANVVAVTCAIMKRYQIDASNLVGHQEIDRGKSDPGNKFMALIRMMIGIKGLVSADQELKELIFGQYLISGVTPLQAVVKYFLHIHDYLTLIATPRTIFEWEIWSQYWHVLDLLRKTENCDYCEEQFISPVQGYIKDRGQSYLKPSCQEGVDIYPMRFGTIPVKLIGTGLCLYAGKSLYTSFGSTVVFRHRLSNGAEAVSILGNLDEIYDLKVGFVYPRGTEIGSIDVHDNWDHLHLAMAYSSTWEKILNQKPPGKLESSQEWINDHYFDPEKIIYLKRMPKEGMQTKFLKEPLK